MYHINLFDIRWAEADAVRRLLERSVVYNEPLDGWQYEKFDYTGINKYRKLSEGVIHFDEMWDTEGTYFFRREVELPAVMEETDWYLEFEIGGECEVYVGDVPVGSLDTEHHDVLAARGSRGGTVLPVTIQATRHAHDYVRIKRSQGKEYGYHIFRKALLVVRKKKLVEFSSLLTVVLQLMDCDVLESKVRDSLHEILKQVLYEIDYFADMDTLEAQVEKGYGRLLSMVQGLHPETGFGESIFMGHSHLDLAFKWTYKETYRKMERTLSNTVCLMERYPQVVFVQSQLHILETLSTGYPELFRRVRKLDDEGRLEVAGDTYVEFDTNIPSGESLIRQFLVGKSLAHNLTGTDSRVCFLPDTFGYSGILPQILRQAGFQYFVTAKLAWNDTNRPEHLSFLWEGIDGSRIRTHLIESYGGSPDPMRLNSLCRDERCGSMPNGDRHIYQYGAGDGGGGISEENILSIQALDELKAFTQVSHKTLEQAMESVFEGVEEGALPLREGELYFENHRGVYTSQERIKKGNRGLEHALHRTELLGTLSYINGHTYYQEEITEIWKKLLLNQFHDIIAGSCIRQVVEEADRDFAQGIAECDRLNIKILQDLGTEGGRLTLINPLGFQAGGVMKIQLPYPVKDLDGSPVQMTQNDEEGCWGLVYIDSIPPFGCRRFDLGGKLPDGTGKGQPGSLENSGAETETVKMQNSGAETGGTDMLENSRYLIRFNDNGEIIQLYDKLHDRQVLRGKGNFLRVHVDRGGYFESWNITSDIERKVYPVDEVESMELMENGPVRKTLRIRKTFRRSVIEQDISIYEGSSRIDFFTRADFKEPQMLLKAGFDVDVDAPVAVYDISMGNIARETSRSTSFEKAKFEVNTHKFMDLSAKDYGVAILNDCKYGCDVAGSTMRISLIKTATFPDENQDIGLHEFCYSLYPHAGDVREGRVREEAYQLNQPLFSVMGDVPLPDAPVICSAPGIMVETFKKEEHGPGVILRLYEHYGRKREFSLRFHLPVSEVYRCNVLEEELPGESMLREGAEVVLSVRPYEIITLKLCLG